MENARRAQSLSNSNCTTATDLHQATRRRAGHVTSDVLEIEYLQLQIVEVNTADQRTIVGVCCIDKGNTVLVSTRTILVQQCDGCGSYK